MKPINVLIVEDDEETAWPLYYDVFKMVDDMVIAAEARTMTELCDLDLRHIDLILMDGTVERSDDGYHAAKMVLQVRPDMPIILSSYAPSFAMAREAGCRTAWRKGWTDRHDLPDLIRSVLDGTH